MTLPGVVAIAVNYKFMDGNQDFVRRNEELRQEGWRIYLLKPYRLNGEILYSAVWVHQPDQPQPYAFNMRYADFKVLLDQREAEGWRLDQFSIL